MECLQQIEAFIDKAVYKTAEVLFLVVSLLFAVAVVASFCLILLIALPLWLFAVISGWFFGMSEAAAECYDKVSKSNDAG